MKNLTKIDFSETLNGIPRSDICQSVNNMLNACSSFRIEYLNLSDNFLDYDGARGFNQFLSTNTTIKTLKLDNCKLGLKSCQMMLTAVEKNSKLKLKEFSASGNDF